MKEENNILAKISRRDGLTVPDGYFADFAAKMADKLPHRDEVEKPHIMPRRTPWQIMRPYVYMVAMFVGVWCMLKMFTLMSGKTEPINFDNDPTLAGAATNEEFVEEYILDDVSQYELDEYFLDAMDEGDSLSISEPTVPETDPDIKLP